MANTYYKIFNKQKSSEFVNDLLEKVQQDLRTSVKYKYEDLYNVTKELGNDGYKMSNLDVNMLLKFYLVKQFLNDSSQDSIMDDSLSECRYRKTANSKIVYDTENECYCKISKTGKYVDDKTIVTVNDDGSFVKVTNIANSIYKIKTSCKSDGSTLSIQMLDSNERIVTNKHCVAEILGMKKEYVNRFKYAGYSGNSVDILAAIGNTICAPIESGYYMDSRFNLYRWSENKKVFIKDEKNNLSPLLTDYSFENSKKVIRKEYIGA